MPFVNLVTYTKHQQMLATQSNAKCGFAVVDLVFNAPPLFVGVLCLSLFWYALLCVHSSFAIILKRKRNLVGLILLSYICFVTINVLWLFLTVLLAGLQCVIVVFPDHTNLLVFVLPRPVHKGSILILHWQAAHNFSYDSPFGKPSQLIPVYRLVPHVC